MVATVGRGLSRGAGERLLSSRAPVACQDDLPDLRAHRAFKVSADRLHHVTIASFSEEGLSLDIDLPEKVALASIGRELEDAISMTAHEIDPPRQREGDHLSHEHCSMN